MMSALDIPAFHRLCWRFGLDKRFDAKDWQKDPLLWTSHALARGMPWTPANINMLQQTFGCNDAFDEHVCAYIKTQQASLPTVVLLTGKAASGKTQFERALRAMGEYVIDADAVTHHLYEHHAKLREGMAFFFGKRIFNAEGHIDRRVLRQDVFSSKRELALLEQLVHPFVLADIFQSITKARGQYERVFISLPLYAKLHAQSVWFWYARMVVDIQRPFWRRVIALRKRNLSLLYIVHLMRSQRYPANASHIIRNNGSELSDIHRQVENLLLHVRRVSCET